MLEFDLRGDVKRLSNHFPEYRMRAGDYRRVTTLGRKRRTEEDFDHG